VRITKKKDGYKEEYFVLADDKKVKHGAYKKINSKNQIVIEGNYQNNVRIEEWNFYLNEKLEQVYNYSIEKLTYYLAPDYSFRYIGNEKLTVPPLFIGGKEELNSKLNELMIYPGQARQMEIEGKVTAEFLVNSDNSLSDVYVTRGIGAGCDEELEKALKKITDGWLAGERENEKINCKVTLTVEFKLSGISLL
jgi:hypothetical protein